MALTFTLYEAAKTYGLDDMSPSGAATLASIYGAPGVPTVIGNFDPGTTTYVSTPMANGFTAELNIYFSSDVAGTVTLLQTRSPFGELVLGATGAFNFTADDADKLTTPGYVFSGDDNYVGNSANNTFIGYAGDDVIDGGAGTDTAVFRGLLSQYSLSRVGGSFDVSGPDGADMLVNIERLRFDDYSIAYDTAGNAGQAYRLYQAAFDRTPDLGGLGYQMRALDHGLSLAQVAGNFIASPEFQRTYGALNDVQFVTQLYANVLHRAPDAGGLTYHTDHLAHGFTRADILVGFSESPENQLALIGSIQSGMLFV
jgi:Ca2+-binding RTX toxin-like protein